MTKTEYIMELKYKLLKREAKRWEKLAKIQNESKANKKRKNVFILK